MRLLLVEDVATLAETARKLRRLGHVVVAASSRLEASAVVGSFECAIIDVRLADGDGIDLARRLLDSSRARKVIFFFAHLEDGCARARCEGVGACVSRSSGLVELSRALESVRARLSSGVVLVGHASRSREKIESR